MPTFTYRIEYRGHTKPVRIWESNPTGWIGQVVQEVFPSFEISEPSLIAKIIRAELVADKTHAGKWRLQCNDKGSGSSLSVVETKIDNEALVEIDFVNNRTAHPRPAPSGRRPTAVYPSI